MFEIRCIVADKRLSEVLHALRKLTLEPPVVVPIGEELQRLNGSSKHAEGGRQTGIVDSTREFITNAVMHGAKTISTKQIKEYLSTRGIKGVSPYSYPVKILCQEKVLKKTKTPGLYEVIKNG